MIRIIENFKGERKEIGCIGCTIEKGDVKNDFVVLQTKYFTVAQNFEVPIPGFLILSTRRHIKSIEELNQGEKKEFADVLIKTRKTLRKILKIDTVYLHQEESTEQHFHVWIFPRYKWMKKFGTQIESVRPIMKYAKENLKTKDNLEKVKIILKKLKDYFSEKENRQETNS